MQAMLNLPPVTEPYLPPKLETDPEFTLVVDLDETLIHFIEVGASRAPLHSNNLDGSRELLLATTWCTRVH